MRRIDYYIGVFIIAGAIMVSGYVQTAVSGKQAQAPKVITAQEFRLVNVQGKTTAVLKNLKDGRLPSLTLNGPDGKERLKITGTDDGGYFTVIPGEDKAAGGILISGSSKFGSSLMLSGSKDNQAVLIQGGPAHGQPDVSVHDEYGNIDIFPSHKHTEKE